MLKDGLSPCQKLSVEDCHIAIMHLKMPDKLSIVGNCPENCNICLYAERFKRDDVNWEPSPIDLQYNHWKER